MEWVVMWTYNNDTHHSETMHSWQEALDRFTELVRYISTGVKSCHVAVYDEKGFKMGTPLQFQA